jgi:hypothetical protein
LKAGLWFRRGLFVMLSPVHGSLRRVQAEFPLIQVVQISRASSREWGPVQASTKPFSVPNFPTPLAHQQYRPFPKAAS